MMKRLAGLAAFAAAVLTVGSMAVPAPAAPISSAAASSPAALSSPAGPEASSAGYGAGRVYRIMPLGDSITRGGGQTKGTYVGYRGPLQRFLKAGSIGFRYDFVGSMSDKGAPDRNHEGHGGWTIDNLSEHIDQWMQWYRPDIVLLHAGTNNLSVGDSPETTAEKLAVLIAQIRSHDPDTRIFVAEVVRPREPARLKRTAEYQNLIPGVVHDAGPNVFLVDQSTVGGRDIYDWTHPNAFGYQKMAYNWYNALNEVISGGSWRPMTNPYRARQAYVCQIHYGAGAKRVCSSRSVL